MTDGRADNAPAYQPTIEQAVEQVAAKLAAAGLPTPRLDARLLAGHALGVDKEHLIAHGCERFPLEALEGLSRLVERRLLEEPVAYIRGIKEFWSLELEVGPGVLIPRPDTEILVQACIDHLLAHGGAGSWLADVGTGSGAVAIAIAHTLPRVSVIATDASREALGYAKRNAARHGVADRVHLVRCDLVSAIGAAATRAGAGPIACVAANLPYVAAGEIPALARGVRDHEPREALDGGTGGIEIVSRLVAEAPSILDEGGLIALEVADKQAPAVAAMLAGTSHWRQAATRRDLGGLKRVVTARRSN